MVRESLTAAPPAVRETSSLMSPGVSNDCRSARITQSVLLSQSRSAFTGALNFEVRSTPPAVTFRSRNSGGVPHFQNQVYQLALQQARALRQQNADAGRGLCHHRDADNHQGGRRTPNTTSLQQENSSIPNCGYRRHLMKPMSQLDYERETVRLTIRERSITPMAASGTRACRRTVPCHRIFSAS